MLLLSCDRREVAVLAPGEPATTGSSGVIGAQTGTGTDPAGPDASERVDAATSGPGGGSDGIPSLSLRPPETCTGLFGRPSETTGLDDATCKPECGCADGVFRPPTYTEADVAHIEAWTLLDPPAELTANPYLNPSAHPQKPGEFCAMVPDSAHAMGYRLRSFPSAEAARTAGGIVTHTGACGLCSTLKDLAVYIRRPDLTTPVRKCGLDHFAGSMSAHVRCLQALGFELPCAQIWYYNTVNTRNNCLAPCVGGLRAKYHKPDGSLNACIQCDEDKSGPIFKAVAGRTRRNSGLPAALCRPCNTVSRIIHDYPAP